MTAAVAEVLAHPATTSSAIQPRQSIDRTKPRSFSNPQPPQLHTNKIKHRSSKPILAWVQRKFSAAGAVKKDPQPTTKAGSSDPSTSNSAPRAVKTYTAGQLQHEANRHHNRSKSGPQSLKSKHSHSTRAHPTDRQASSQQPLRKKTAQGGQHVPPALAISNARPGGPSNVMAYNSDSPPSSPLSDSVSLSLAPGSTWSPDPLEADDDASIRPLPPTSPPSPAPSRTTHYTVSSQTSGYLSDPRTFRSVAASTKPTTLLSIDLFPGGGGGMAHIAQVAPSITSGRSPSIDLAPLPAASPSSPAAYTRYPGHTRQHSGGNPATTPTSLMFSLPGGSRHPLAAAQHAEDLASDPEDDTTNENVKNHAMQAPILSHPHPRNNPRPSSPPPDNASILTLASSTFANHRPMTGGYASSIVSRFPGSLSMYGGGSIHRILNGNESIVTAPGLEGAGVGGGGGQDPDASVRALRPRSRRGSWASVGSAETNQTGWSAAVLNRLGPAGRKRREDVEGDDDDLYAAGDEDDGLPDGTKADESVPGRSGDEPAPRRTLSSGYGDDLLGVTKLEVILATPDDSKVGTPVKEPLELGPDDDLGKAGGGLPSTSQEKNSSAVEAKSSAAIP